MTACDRRIKAEYSVSLLCWSMEDLAPGYTVCSSAYSGKMLRGSGHKVQASADCVPEELDGSNLHCFRDVV